ncbi:poly-gamma-glutamate synthesis protein (capsule biosynthesis protein) [Evansella vedderi]|uniref:Poly-gamma-glutamate synthesis protein (Capsule biosynthesis protein) n=1 Tax=Evansella vedderi TaxID=38282 RepID=A0ABT9ZTA3_9BACI|nr:CapA family protein [Evansella vedderi]MDQ0254466.1 poly-gamma-glutamate synthesis protein (capsule biosynthesis protein) [Evansella vedderi]
MKIVLIGDTLLNEKQIKIDDKVISECQDADLVILNLEGPITDAPPMKTSGSAISSSPDNIHYLKELNVSVAILGNNHIMDHGVQGLNDTKNILKENGIRFVGADDKQNQICSPSILEYNNIVIFSYAHYEGPMYGEQGFGPVELPSLKTLNNKIKDYKEKGFKVIFNYHGGEEFFTIPWPRRRGFLTRLSNLGADIVFAHHSHSVQPLEIKNGKLIIYSPGNFYMDTPYQRNNINTNKGFITIIANDLIKKLEIVVDREKKEIKVFNSLQLSLLTDVVIPECEAKRKWISECKQIFNKPVRRSSLLSNFNFIVRIIRYILFTKQLIKLKIKIRDLDILISSLPIIGTIYTNRLYRKGYKKFKF